MLYFLNVDFDKFVAASYSNRIVPERFIVAAAKLKEPISAT